MCVTGAGELLLSCEHSLECGSSDDETCGIC